MPIIKISFLAGRYHATPAGHHVNEGQIEWPPSPWRLLRALIATGYSKLQWGNELPANAVLLIEGLSEVLPRYALPEAGASHTRHYMPQTTIDKDRGVENTALVFDAFAHSIAQPIWIAWPAELAEEVLKLLNELLSKLSYLGRAESWIEAELIEVPPSDIHFDCEPAIEMPRAGYEQIVLLAAQSADNYSSWYQSTTASVDAPFVGLKKLSSAQQKTRTKALAPYPATLLDALQQDSAFWQKHGWSQPPGSRRIWYWRKYRALELPASPPPSMPIKKSVEAILLSVSPASGNLDALAPRQFGLKYADRLHANLVRIAIKRGEPLPVITGKDVDNNPVSDHSHLHILPLSLEGNNRIDHFLLHASAGLCADAQRAIRAARTLYTKGQSDFALAVAALGPLPELLSVRALSAQFKPSKLWLSSTPFVPVRYLKKSGRNTLSGQVLDELKSRGFATMPKAIYAVPAQRDDASGDHARKLRHFNIEREKLRPKQRVGYCLILEFTETIRPPLSLGYASHFGLGLFQAVEAIPTGLAPIWRDGQIP
jgi:CRISPR-associated protein Csb2